MATHASATTKSGISGSASLIPLWKYWEVVIPPPALMPLSPRRTPSPVARSFLWKQAGQASQLHSSQRYTWEVYE